MIQVLKKFSELLEKGQKKRIIVLFVLMLIGAGLEVIGVSLMVPLMTAIMNPNIIFDNKIVSVICEILDLHSHRTFSIVCICALIGVFVIKDSFLMLEYYVQARFITNNKFATQSKLLKSYLLRPYEYFLNADSGEIITNIKDDVRFAYELLSTLLLFFTESIIALALIVTIVVIDPVMSLIVAFIMFLTLLIIAKVIRPQLKKAGVERQNQEALSYKWLQQSIVGIKECKIEQSEEYFQDKFNQSGKRLTKAERLFSLTSNMPRLMIEMVSVCSMLSIIAVMMFKGRALEELMPSLGALALAAVKLMPSANRIIGAVNSISFYTPALDRTLNNVKMIDEDRSIQLRNTVKEDDSANVSFKECLEISDVTYTYPNSSFNVLEKASVAIPVGSSVGIVGASGAGKTTLVDIMLGLLKPKEGQVLADGRDIKDNYKDWLNHISYIPQSIFILDDTIKANIAFGVDNNEIDEEQVWHTLEDAQLAEYVRSLPDGINTNVGDRGIRLSGGQRQRIGIARSLYTNPDILFFDEATSALDNETEAAIMESINNLHGKKTMLIIAHRLQTIEQCDMVFRVKDGKVTKER